MDPVKQIHFERQLNELKTQLESALKMNAEDSEVVTLDTNIGRISRIEQIQNQHLAKELKERQEAQLQRVDRALKKLKKGQYGICPTCKKPISEERLEVQPDAVQCVQCAETR